MSWLNVSFLSGVHLFGLGGAVAYLWLAGLPGLGVLLMALCWTALTIFSLSGGYHRLFSHRAYEAHPVVRFLFLAFGAAAFQNSALTWAADHRRHHRRVDTDLDPYSVRRGFWWAHIGWVLRRTPPATDLQPVPDLERDPLVRWQHRGYPVIGTAVGFVAPALVGWLAFGDPWGGLVFGGLLRLVFVYHVTFSVNSFAHMVGRQPYSDRDSSRDSALVALLSMGEGYHNFHHTFPADYRNGVRAWHFDPSKWAIRLLALVRLARRLRRTPAEAIARARRLRRPAAAPSLGANREAAF